jgi:hypothetical protein
VGAVADAIKVKEAAERRLSKDGPSGASVACDALHCVSVTLRALLIESSVSNVLPPDTCHEAKMALGETLCGAAAAGLTAVRLAPLSPELTAAEGAASVRAVELYRDAAAVLEDLCSSRGAGGGGGGGLGGAQRDYGVVGAETVAAATTAAANALAAWGDLVLVTSPRDAAPVLARAAAAYEAAVRLEEAALSEQQQQASSSAPSVGLSLLGVRLVTWTLPAVIN